MSRPGTVSPSGIDAKNLLEDAINEVDNDLTTQSKVGAFHAQDGVETSPLIFIDDEPIGGNEDLRRWLARNAH
jgi:glutaredoxin 3